MTVRNVYIIVFDGCEILDVAGPVQALFEANSYGAAYNLQYCATNDSIRTAQGMTIADLSPLPDVRGTDWLLIPGYVPTSGRLPQAIVEWLQDISADNCLICSICTGAFILGASGLLAGKSCTTHWKYIHRLQEQFPQAKVLENRLYVQDGQIYSSAGIAAGIDMTLHLIEQDLGSQVAASVAREMVVYARRDGSQPQASIYLNYQNHLHAGVHQVQQYLIQNPASKATLSDLAKIAHMSSRHLTRIFRQETGISIGGYRRQLRLEQAKTLIEQSSLTLDVIAATCGFANARQLRRIWKHEYQIPPSKFRK